MNAKLRVVKRYTRDRITHPGWFILVPQYWRSDLSKWEDLPVIDEWTNEPLNVVPVVAWWTKESNDEAIKRSLV